MYKTQGCIKGMHNPQGWKREVKDSIASVWRICSLDEVLSLLDNGIPPHLSFEELVDLLHKCRKERNRAHALRLHAYMCKNGLETDESLGSYLVLMLAETEIMHNAHGVFDGLVRRNELSWKSLITGYIRCGKPHYALSLYQEMQKDNCVRPMGNTFVALLKACAKLRKLEQGMEIHEQVSRLGLLERDHFLGSTLVDMYAKCGSLTKARKVFDELSLRDVVSWTALIRGYSDHGHVKLALKCFEQMKLEGVSPDTVTFVCSLKACGSIRDQYRGHEIHAEVERLGLFETEMNVGNTLVDMYAKCGSLAEAQHVFDKLAIRDVVSWTALIAGYAENGQGRKALQCFEEMQVEGVSPNPATFVCSLKASASIKDADKGYELHAEVERRGFLERDLVVGNMVVDMYVKCGLLNLAHEVFDKLFIRDVVSWTTMIVGYAEHGHGEEALKCFEQMQSENIQPNATTYICTLKACARTRDKDKGQEIHSQIKRKGLLNDFSIGTSLVDMYAKCGLLARAQEVFDNLTYRDVVSWNALITGYADYGHDEEALQCFEQMQLEGVLADAVTFVCSLKACVSIKAAVKAQELHVQIIRKGLFERDLAVGTALMDTYAKCGNLVKAQQVFDKLPIRDVVSWTALTASYAEHGLGEEALSCLEQMQLQGILLNSATLVCILKACGNIGATDKGKELHAEIERKGLLERDIAVGNTLIDMYAKCGLLAFALQVFDRLLVRDVVSWNSLMAGHIQREESAAPLHIFDRMLSEGVEPNPVTFLIVLNACSRIGLLNISQTYFDAMSKDFGIVPSVEHHTSMVHLLCQAGQLDKAIAVIQSIPSAVNFLVWRTVLSACQTCRNVEFGNQAFKNAVGLD